MRETTGGRPSVIDATVAATVRAELARHQIRQRELATRIGRTPNWLSRRLTGEIAFTLGEIHEVAQALGIPVAALLDVAA